jgi:hypothetical protein
MSLRFYIILFLMVTSIPQRQYLHERISELELRITLGNLSSEAYEELNKLLRVYKDTLIDLDLNQPEWKPKKSLTIV